MELGRLSKIFMDVFAYLYSCEFKRKHYENITDPDDLEEKLLSYLHTTYTFKFDYSHYYAEVRMYFENILVNIPKNRGFNLAQSIDDYVNKLNYEFETHPLSKLFMDKARKLYSGLDWDSVIRHNNKSYTIQRIYREREIDMPSLYISNIDEFEEILSEFINNVKNSKSDFKACLNFKKSDNETDIISELLIWIVKNCTCYELANVTDFFRKYSQYINDNTFDKLENTIKIGTLLNQDLRMKIRKSSCHYETPYFLSFILGNINTIELPNIRLGIELQDNKKVAHILATQSSQDNCNLNYLSVQEENLKNLFKTENKRYRNIQKDQVENIRHFNTLHTYSIILTLGLLKGMNIDKVQIASYLPLRLQSKILMDNYSDYDIDKYKYRLTNLNMMTYIKVVSDMSGIEIEEYPDLDGTLKLLVTDNVTSDNKLFKQLYDYGLMAGKQNKSEKDRKVLIKKI